jgi:hypothetical protein
MEDTQVEETPIIAKHFGGDWCDIELEDVHITDALKKKIAVVATDGEEARIICIMVGRGEPSDEETAMMRANAKLISAGPDMVEALEAQEAVDQHICNCEDCCDGAFPELCEEGVPFADHARVLRMAALAKVRGEAAWNVVAVAVEILLTSRDKDSRGSLFYIALKIAVGTPPGGAAAIAAMKPQSLPHLYDLATVKAVGVSTKKG